MGIGLDKIEFGTTHQPHHPGWWGTIYTEFFMRDVRPQISRGMTIFHGLPVSAFFPNETRMVNTIDWDIEIAGGWR